MTPNKVRFQILLEPEQLEALRGVERRTGASIGGQVRLAVDRWLKAHGAKATSRPRAKRGRKV